MISKKIIGIISVLAVIAVVFAGSAAAVSSTYATDSNILVSNLNENLDSSSDAMLILNTDGTVTIARLADLSATGTDAAQLKDAQFADLAAFKSMNMLNKASVGTTAAKLSRLNSAALQSNNVNFANIWLNARYSSNLAGLNTLANSSNVIVCPASELNNHLINLAGLNTLANNSNVIVCPASVFNTKFSNIACLNNDGTFSIIPASVANFLFLANTNDATLFGNTLNSSALNSTALQNMGVFFYLPVCLNVSNAELAEFLKADGTFDLAKVLRAAANNAENETFSLSSDLQNMIQNAKDSAVSTKNVSAALTNDSDIFKSNERLNSAAQTETEFSIAGTKTVAATDDAVILNTKKVAANENATLAAQKEVTFSSDAKDNVLSPVSGFSISALAY